MTWGPWGPFSAEALKLTTKVHALTARGLVSDAVSAVEEALKQAHRDGPSNMSRAAFEASVDAPKQAAKSPDC